MPHVEVDGRRLHYVRQGQGEPLLLIQGLSGNHLHWGEDFLALLREEFDVVAFDNRGIGHSDRVTEPFTIPELATDVNGLMDALELDSAHVLGISMGGMIAQELALERPERVRTLTLGGTYCGGEGARLTDERIVHRLAELFMTGRAEEALRFGFEVNVSTAFAEDPVQFERVTSVAEQLPASLDILLLQVQAVAAHDTSGRLPGLRVPTLVIHGTEDRMLPVDNGRLIARLVPDARLEILDGVGHAFWWERPEHCAQLLREHAAAAAPAQ